VNDEKPMSSAVARTAFTIAQEFGEQTSLTASGHKASVRERSPANTYGKRCRDGIYGRRVGRAIARRHALGKNPAGVARRREEAALAQDRDLDAIEARSAQMLA
jgi:hypothetical protein